MCGIAGAIHFDATSANPQLVQRMVDQLTHRGPDASGVVTADQCVLGHARLSIIDLAGGLQPMQTEDGRFTITFNGEIFNYVELRQQLTARGHRFQTQSDTEVLLKLYVEYGSAAVDLLNGQWAFAIWDRAQQTLFASRDRYGIRPFFFTHAGSRLSFASELKALLQDPLAPRTIDVKALAQVFSLWSPLAPRTIFDGVRELPAGHNLFVSGGQLEMRRYWRPDYHATDLTTRSYPELRDELFTLLNDATRLRLRSDVPVGAYLSGGLDSSITTSLIRDQFAGELQTFSVQFDDADYDESAYQLSVAKHLGATHHTVSCSPTHIGEIFPDVIRHTERPILRTAPAPLYLLSQLVQQHGIKVVMTGEGADEVFGGYDIFKEARFRRFWARQPDSKMRPKLLQQLYPYMPALQKQPAAYLQAFFQARSEDLQHPFFSHAPRWDLTRRLQKLFSSEVQDELRDYDETAELLRQLPDVFEQWKPLHQAQYLEATTLLPGYILCSQSDRMAMAHSIEGRFPFLDHRLAEFAGRLPQIWKICGNNEKHLLKKAFADALPAQIIDRPKQPYRAPDVPAFFDAEKQAARFEWVDDLLSPERIRHQGLFDEKAVSRLVSKARAGRATGVKDSMGLVGVLSTQLLIEQFAEQTAAAKSPPRVVRGGSTAT